MRPRSGPRDPDRRIGALADVQRGVVGRPQLLALGLSSAAIARRARDGRLRTIHRGVYAVGHTALRREGWWMAAVLACGEGAVLSHRTAAAVWGFGPAGGARVDVAIPTRSGRTGAAGVALHRPRSLPAGDIARHDGLPVTTPARTLADMAAVVRREALARAVAGAERLRVDVGDLEELLARRGRRSGARNLRAALADIRIEDGWTRSGLERRFLRLCSAHGLPVPAVNAWIAGMEVDFCWAGELVIVEVDGQAFHRTRHAFEADHRRTIALTLAGYTVLRFTDRQVMTEPATVGRAVALALASPAVSSGAAPPRSPRRASAAPTRA